MKIIAHRGLCLEHPEGTLLSFDKALEAGFGIEVDVQQTKDKKLVVVHDRTLKRYGGPDKTIPEMDSKEVMAVDYHGQRIAFFDDVCKLYRAKAATESILAIHVKDEHQGSIIKDLVSEIDKESVADRCLIFDITLECAKRIKQANPLIKVGISVSECMDYETLYPLEAVLGSEFIDVIWWDEFKELYTEEDARKIRTARKINYAISPELHIAHGHPRGKQDYEETWKDLIRWGVDGICTDHPKEFQQIWQELAKDI